MLQLWVVLRLCLLLLFIWSNCVKAFDYHCFERKAPQVRESQFCPGVTFPESRTRNFYSEELRCGGRQHVETRTWQPFDEEIWRDKLAYDAHGAYQMLRDLPAPEWTGELNYPSHIHWWWEACELTTDAYVCGTQTVCSPSSDKDSKKDCREEAKTCWADISKQDSIFCQQEAMRFEVQFLKKDTTIWNPDHPEFIPRLANGYDLLPGEREEIIFDNGAGYFFASSVMNPYLSFNKQRNQYQVMPIEQDGFDSEKMQCKKGAVYKVGFRVLPVARIKSRSGNAFTLPESYDGEAMDSLIWQSAIGVDGRRHQKAYPVSLITQDASHVALQEFASDTGSFFGGMVVRVQLYQFYNNFSWPFEQSTMYIEDGKGIKMSLNALSKEQSIRRSALWEIPLEVNTNDPRNSIYRRPVPWFIYYPLRLLLSPEMLSYEHHLSPDTLYSLELSVYQKNMTIYYQSCSDDPEAWDCQWYAGGGWLSPTRYENSYFSDDKMTVLFSTDKDVDLRSGWSIFWTGVSYIDKIVGSAVLLKLVLKWLEHSGTQTRETKSA